MAAITIDGRQLTLRWDFNSLVRAEKQSGVNILSAVTHMVSGLTSEELRGLLLAFLLPDQPDVTVDEAGALLRIDTILLITQAIDTAISETMPRTAEATHG
jgi:hypothetical protein